GGGGGGVHRGALRGALARAGRQKEEPPAGGPPPAPPSEPIGPGEPIPYATLAEHLTFNTKSRMELMGVRGQVVRVRGPVGKVEPDGTGATLHLGAAQGSRVRAHLAEAADVQGIREGQEVDVVGTFAFRGDYVLLEDARLGGDPRPPSHPAPQVSAQESLDPLAPGVALWGGRL